MKTRHELLMQDPEYRRLFAIESLVTDAAELVAQLMQDQRVNKAELARRLGKSRAWVTQLLSGRANMTIRTFAEAVYALGSQVKLDAQPQVAERDQPSVHQSWATAFSRPCVVGPWTVAAERKLPGHDRPPGRWPKYGHGEAPERLGYAA
jgi:DNA-binding phage protein